MTCPKAAIGGVWACGRPARHLGGHLSVEAYLELQKQQVELRTELDDELRFPKSRADRQRQLVVRSMLRRVDRALDEVRS